MQETAYTPLTPAVRTLPNGLTIVSEHLPYLHSTSIGVWIMAGSANEKREQAGISHFLEHLFFKGTDTRSARDLMDAIESRGGQMNAFTTREHTCLFVKTLDRHAETGLEILADIVKHSTFRDLDKERNVILEEIATGKDSPDEHIHDLLSEQTWPGHALGRPIAGYEETVEKTTLQDVRNYKEARYQPENMYIAVVGKFDEDTLLRQIIDAFGELPSSEVVKDTSVPTFNAGIYIEERDIAQNHLACAFPSISILDPARYTFDMLSSTLGGGSTSRLFETIREKEGLAYAIYSFNSMFLNAGVLGIYAAIAPENLQRTLDLCVDEMHKLQDAAMPEEELLSNREQLKGGLLLALEGTFNRMARMVRSLMLFDRIVPIEEILASVDGVTAQDVQQLAQKVFTKDNCAMAVLGPRSETPLNLAL